MIKDMVKAREDLDGLDGHGLLAKEESDRICADWGVKPIACDVKWKSKLDAAVQGLDWVAVDAGEAVWGLRLLCHLCDAFDIDTHTMYIGRGRQAGELKVRLLAYLDTLPALAPMTVDRHCEKCGHSETLTAIVEGFFSSDADFCTKCGEPWGSGLVHQMKPKDAETGEELCDPQCKGCDKKEACE